MKAVRKVLGWIPEFEFEIVDASCCGMSGSFGLEAEHYEASVAMGELVLLPAVRAALLALQKRFRSLPGLVADGRDMGTVIFPDSTLKVFLTASAAQRAMLFRSALAVAVACIGAMAAR
jgi:hypothetical protein